MPNLYREQEFNEIFRRSVAATVEVLNRYPDIKWVEFENHISMNYEISIPFEIFDSIKQLKEEINCKYNSLTGDFDSIKGESR